MKLVRLSCAILVVHLAALANCSSDAASPAAPAADAGGSDAATATSDATSSDATGTDATEDEGPAQEETEPNGGALGAGGEPEKNDMTVPGSMRGTIDPADDNDIFAIGLAPGEMWRYTIEAQSGAKYVPHLTVFDTKENNLNPTQLVKAKAASTVATLDHFVLRKGDFVAAVRDARNVPADTSSHVGGSDLGYRFAAKRITPQPKTVNLPETVTGALESVSNVALFSFTTTKNTNVEIVVKAARKSSPSDLDSRLSLFHVASKTAVLTNDNAGGVTSDSEIRGPMPLDGEYYVILENEAAMVFDPSNVPDLSYEIAFTLK